MAESREVRNDVVVKYKSFPISKFFAGVLLILLTLGCSLQGIAQSRTITGRVLAQEDNSPLPGVNVLVKGTSSGTVTDGTGSYSISIPGNEAVLVFSFIGYTAEEVVIGTRNTVDVSLVQDVQSLQEVVVTGYTTERKRDIIGSVAVVKTQELLATPASNLQSQLQGRASGVTVSGNGAPGAGAKVRIRGFASFGNNDPLYVIDGVPTEDPSQLNPQDIESIQILKDATSASIYGSRAANGVIIVTTRQGKAGTTKIAIDSYAGVQVIPKSTFPKMLNTQQYADYLWRSAQGAGQVPRSAIFGNGATPVIPDYLVISNGFKGGVAANDPRVDPSLYNINSPDPADFYQIVQTSPGTQWFDEITKPARIQSHQLSANGGSEKGVYALGLNYFNQEGTFPNTGYDRFTVRANTMFKPFSSIRIGENLQISYEDRKGNDNVGEGGAWAWAYRNVPYLPVYDINGGYAGTNISESGNGENIIANLERNKNDKNYGYKIFGNAFAEVDIFKYFTARTSFGLDYGNNFQQDYDPITYEQSENTTLDTYTERFGYGVAWTWTNTLLFQNTFADIHNVKVLLGTEAISSAGKRIVGSNQGYDFGGDPDFRSLNTGTRSPLLSNDQVYRNALYSQFARLDYALNDKYLFNATVRRDGSSKFGSNTRYGVFPAFGIGWRISGEEFMKGVPFISDLKLRAGWGQMGSQKNVDPANSYSFFQSGRATSWYDINGTSNSPTTGYRQDRLGNTNTKWETTETTNIGLDASLFDSKVDISFEVYNIDTKDLLVERQRNGLEPLVAQPRINVGTMRNRGFDLNLGTRGTFANDLRYDATLTFTRFTNKALRLNNEGSAFFERGASRLGGVARTTEGQPISSFYGYKLDGFFQNEEEVTNGPTMPYKAVGSWRIKDLNNDGAITDADKTFIGSPIPDFQTGLNLSLGYKNFDLTAFLFWNYGNEVYNFTKWFTDLRGFVGGVSTRVLTDSWTPENRNASLPVLNSSDPYSGTISSDFYVESGSYLRLRTLQLGYTVPTSLLSKIYLSNARLYLQGQNLFTISKYSGPDPDISIQGGDELLIGVDQSGFPNSRQFILGVSIGF